MRWLVLALILLSSDAYAVIGSRHGGTPIPAAASSVGYTINTFHTGSFSTSNIDKSLTYASGFQWYFANFFSNQTPSNAVTINSDGTISILYNGNSNGSLASIGQIAGSPFYVGTAFGCGAYMTAEISFNPTTVTESIGFPAWWAMAAEHLVNLSGQQWTGQVAGYLHFSELDIFEFDRDQAAFPYAYGGTIIDWYGNSATCAPNSLCNILSSFVTGTIKVPYGTDYNLFHRVAALWVPATISTNGYVTFYFDDIPFDTVSWSQFTTQSPPPTTSSPWLFGIIDQQHMALILGSGSGAINVRSVDVWQSSGACNITN